jgi:hypothetical protein
MESPNSDKITYASGMSTWMSLTIMHRPFFLIMSIPFEDYPSTFLLPIPEGDKLWFY